MLVKKVKKTTEIQLFFLIALYQESVILALGAKLGFWLMPKVKKVFFAFFLKVLY